MKKNIVLIGFMATGKSTAGKLLAQKMGMDFVDTDQTIVEEYGKSIAEIFTEHGEDFFRQAESAIIAKTAGRSGQVIATGGGAVVREENFNNLSAGGWMICLIAAPEIIIKRTERDETRPLLADTVQRMEKIGQLLKERAVCYGKADFCVDTGVYAIEEVVEEIESFLAKQNFSGRNDG